MAGITLEQAQAQLDVWLEASLKIASGQEYEAFGRKMKRADLGEVNRQITFWENRVKRMSGITRVIIPVL